MGCDRESASGADPAVRDSAGIRIIENGSGSETSLPRWSIDTTPTVTIGGDDRGPAHELTLIGGVRQLPNGMVLVMNGAGESAFEFRFFDSTGKHVATHGRRGTGPGDYRWINFVGSEGGDTVIAVDFPNRRLNWVSATAGYLRSIPLDETLFKRLLGTEARGTTETLIPLGDSLYAIKAYRSGFRAQADTFSFDVVDIAKGTVTSLGRFEERGGVMHSARVMHVVDRNRKRMCVASSHTTEISCIDSSGARTKIRWRADSIPFTADDRRRDEEGMRARYQTPEGKAQFEARLATFNWPEWHGRFYLLDIDTDGNFWILEPTPERTGPRFDRFRIIDADGRQIAFADPFPARDAGIGSEHHIGPSYVVRIFSDADDVPRVGVFPIRKNR